MCQNIAITVLRLLVAAASSTPDSISRTSIGGTLGFLLLETFLLQVLSDKCLVYGDTGSTKHKEVISERSLLARPFPAPLLFQQVSHVHKNGFGA